MAGGGVSAGKGGGGGGKKCSETPGQGAEGEHSGGIAGEWRQRRSGRGGRRQQQRQSAVRRPRRDGAVGSTTAEGPPAADRGRPLGGLWQPRRHKTTTRVRRPASPACASSHHHPPPLARSTAPFHLLAPPPLCSVFLRRGLPAPLGGATTAAAAVAAAASDTRMHRRLGRPRRAARAQTFAAGACLLPSRPPLPRPPFWRVQAEGRARGWWGGWTNWQRRPGLPRGSSASAWWWCHPGRLDRRAARR